MYVCFYYNTLCTRLRLLQRHKVGADDENRTSYTSEMISETHLLSITFTQLLFCAYLDFHSIYIYIYIYNGKKPEATLHFFKEHLTPNFLPVMYLYIEQSTNTSAECKVRIP